MARRTTASTYKTVPDGTVPGFEVPTSDADFKVEIEKTGRLEIKLPGHKADLLLDIVIVLAVLVAPVLLIMGTRVTLTPEHTIIFAVMQGVALLSFLWIRRNPH